FSDQAGAVSRRQTFLIKYGSDDFLSRCSIKLSRRRHLARSFVRSVSQRDLGVVGRNRHREDFEFENGSRTAETAARRRQGIGQAHIGDERKGATGLSPRDWICVPGGRAVRFDDGGRKCSVSLARGESPGRRNRA